MALHYRFTQYDDSATEMDEGSDTELSFSVSASTPWDEVLDKFLVFLSAVGYIGVEEHLEIDRPAASRLK